MADAEQYMDMLTAVDGVSSPGREDYAGKRVLILGIARSGAAAAELLLEMGACPVLCDSKREDAIHQDLRALKAKRVEMHFEEDPEKLLPGCDMLLISPGVPIEAPIVKTARELGKPVTGEMEAAALFSPCDLVAITGTNGKTTTTALVTQMFADAGRPSVAAGNIGYPLSAAVRTIRPKGVIAVEVSSFQLETVCRFHPKASAILNITPDHLNRHYTMQNYAAVKQRVMARQTAEDVVVLNAQDELLRPMAAMTAARVAWFSSEKEVDQGAFVRDGMLMLRWEGMETPVCPVKDIYIPGRHNLENAMAAALIAYTQGVRPSGIAQTLRTFRGVEHRIEFVRELDGVRWYNDSKGTNVDSTIKAVQTMDRPTILVLGGSDKHVSFAPLAECIRSSGMIKRVVLCGSTAPKIELALKETGYTAILHADRYPEMVKLCKALAARGENVLLSPACASFDQFTDYEERGRVFKQLVNAL